MVVGVDTATGDMTGYTNFPAGLNNVTFGSAIYDGKDVWMIPLSANMVVKLSGVDTIPIYTADQFQAIGTGQNVIINGVGYNFAPNMSYTLMNNISFDYNGTLNLPNTVTLIGNGNTVTINDTSKATQTYYYYNSLSNYKFATTAEGYIYDSMVLWYDGINNTSSGHNSATTTWEDLTENGNDGTLGGFALTSSSGWQDNALVFDGVNDYVNSKYIALNTLTLDLAYEFDALPTSGEQYVAGIIENGGYGISKSSNGNYPYGVAFVDGSYRMLPDTNELFVLEQKRKNILTFDGSTLAFWNGSAQAVSTYSSTTGVLSMPTDHTVPFSLGLNPSPNGSAYAPFFNGKIYAVRLYSRALTADEIAQNNKIDQSRYGIP
jgi:hypothetical protein